MRVPGGFGWRLESWACVRDLVAWPPVYISGAARGAHAVSY